MARTAPSALLLRPGCCCSSCACDTSVSAGCGEQSAASNKVGGWLWLLGDQVPAEAEPCWATRTTTRGDARGVLVERETFRPNSSTVFYPGAPPPHGQGQAAAGGAPHPRVPMRVVEGDLVTEVHQAFSGWASHVIRLSRAALRVVRRRVRRRNR